MQKLKIEGGHKLSGEISIHGAKNSVLPILAASILPQSPTVIRNCPDISDVHSSIKILNSLGCMVHREGDTLTIDPRTMNSWEIPENLMREMRSSIIFLGAITSKMGKAVLSFPGGCEIGLRPIDLHISSLKEMGVKVTEEHGYLHCGASEKLKGCRINLPIPSVGATENIMLAAACADGVTTIVNAAREPEISDLADFLNGCGAKVQGAGEGAIVISGVKKLYGTEHVVIPDRIEAATYMAATAVTGGELILRGLIPAHIGIILPMMEQAGCDVNISGRDIKIIAPKRLNRISEIRTMPYPGFPTDAQALLMAMMTLADGTSMFIENVFGNRYKHAAELIRMGASIKIEDRVAVVDGVKRLSGASVVSTDLRGAAAMVLAGLAAEGETVLSSLAHLDRGYENIEKHLNSVGAKVERFDSDTN